MYRTNITSEETLGQLLEKCANDYPDSDAVVYADRDYRLTWREFNDTVDVIAKGLISMGVKKGDKVAIWATNVPHWTSIMFATAKIGAILLTINTNYKSSEIDYILRQSETEYLMMTDGFRDTDYLNTIYELIPELKEQPRDAFRAAKYPNLRGVIFIGPEKHRGIYSLSEVMSLAVTISDEDYSKRKKSVSCNDVVNMQYTSGTTGFPKGVMLTHFNIANDGYWIGANMNYSHNDRICLPVPLFHCFGCVLGAMAAVNHACTMVWLEQYDPVMVMTAIEQEKCTSVYGVPTMFIGMMEHKLFNKFDFSSLRTGIMAGSPCPIKTMKEAVEKMNMREVTIVYGLTESSPGMTQSTYDEPSLERKCSTVGKALRGIEVEILDPDTGEISPLGKPGEFCCRGYNVMKGYYNMPEETAKAIDRKGWLHSGDLGIKDEEGYFSVTGRIKDMIIRGGENIYPKEVEDFLYNMNGVKDVQVIGVPSVKYGEQPAAFIILKDGVTMSDGDVQDYCRGKIAWYKTPKYVTFIDEFPLTTSGKIMKFKLREMAAELWPDA